MSIRQGTRVAFMGAGGTGKTTTAEFVAPLLDLPMIKSASRTVYEENELTEEKVALLTPEKKLELQTAIFNAKITLDQQYSFLADRTILDHYCYCLAYCGATMPDTIYFQFEEKVRILMATTYSHLFYFPWGYWTPKSDGVRQDLLGWQSQIDALMVGYILRWGLPVIEVPQTLGEDYRNEFVLNSIRGNNDYKEPK